MSTEAPNVSTAASANQYVPRKIDEFLKEVLSRNGSDLHFIAGDPPRIRLYGELTPLRPEILAPQFVEETLREIMRDPYFVPSGTPLFTQLQQFQEHQDRLCFVVDEYGELMGLLTLEDIVEELIGEFATHSPLQPSRFHRQPDGSYLVEGASLLRELNRKLGFRFPLDGPKTLNGLILEHLQDIPEPDTSLKIAGHAMEIVQTQDRVVKAVRLLPPAPAPAAVAAAR